MTGYDCAIMAIVIVDPAAQKKMMNDRIPEIAASFR